MDKPNWYDDPRIQLGDTGYADVASPLAFDIRDEYSALISPEEASPAAKAAGTTGLPDLKGADILWVILIAVVGLFVVCVMACVMVLGAMMYSLIAYDKEQQRKALKHERKRNRSR